MEEKIIEVDMAGMKILQAPGILVTRGLGSCLGISIYDPLKKIGAMAHPMLPDIKKAKIKTNPSRFVNSSIIFMIDELEKMGCSRSRFIVKLFGGAHMFSFIGVDSVLNVGGNNIAMAEGMLKELGLKIAIQETGGTFGRTVELDLETGKVLLRTVSLGEKEV